ncbi:MAG: 6-phosphogluconolactonase [Chthoniobacter sp.]|jgi:6-phosphogluconolactonase|nr:6-phosphogluconolactonase [Chthoniobacter sp.]
MPADVTPRVIRTSAFASEAAGFILDEIRLAVAARGLCRLALSGGQTPRRVFAEMVRQSGVPWNRVQITFSDERCVPPEDADSNFRMARESLLEAVDIPSGNVFRMRGEIDPEIAAREYEAMLAAVAARFGEPRYLHDLVLLGMGPDGHTASLFPGSPALAETQRNVIPATGPKPPPQRLTMTLPLLNAARHVAFLVTGADKQPLVEEITAGRTTLPAAQVRPVDGALTWIVGE